MLTIALLVGCGKSPAPPGGQGSSGSGNVEPVANVEGGAPVAGGATESQDQAMGLEGLLADLEALREQPRDGMQPLPKAVRMLRDYIDSGMGEAKVRTYSATLNEARLVERYGSPDEIGTESIESARKGGQAKIEQLRMLRYGWLRILVSDGGEIQYVKYLRD